MINQACTYSNLGATTPRRFQGCNLVSQNFHGLFSVANFLCHTLVLSFQFNTSSVLCIVVLENAGNEGEKLCEHTGIELWGGREGRGFTFLKSPSCFLVASISFFIFMMVLSNMSICRAFFWSSAVSCSTLIEGRNMFSNLNHLLLTHQILTSQLLIIKHGKTLLPQVVKSLHAPRRGN